MSRTKSLWPVRVDGWLLNVPIESMDQILTDLSSVPLANLVPLGLHATELISKVGPRPGNFSSLDKMDSTNPVRASQTTTCVSCADASLDPSGQKTTAFTLQWGARRLWVVLTHSMMAGVFPRSAHVCAAVGAGRNVKAGSCEASCSTQCATGQRDVSRNK